MKIGSVIKPRTRPTRDVTVHGKKYVFAPVEDNQGEIHYVADVRDELHAETLVGTGYYYHFGKDHEKAPTLARTPSGEKPVLSKAPAPVTAHAAEDVAAATELLKGSISDVGKAVGSMTPGVVRAAIDVEKAQQAPRKGMLDLLNATVEGAIAAGVPGWN